MNQVSDLLWIAVAQKKPPGDVTEPPTLIDIALIPVELLSYGKHIGILYRTPPDYPVNR